MEQHDLTTRVLIVGGGLAGLTLAARLGGAGVPVLLVDRQAADIRTAPEFDGRTTAISYGTRQILDEARVWTPVADDAEPIWDIRIADDRGRFSLHFSHLEMAEESGGDPFGHIVENRLLRLGQLRVLADLPAVTQIAPASVERLAADSGGITAWLADGRTIRAELAIGADGRGSAIRQGAGIAARKRPYDQTAIVCVITHSRPHEGLALEHFMPEGPFAVLPMTDDAEGTPRSSIVWSERPARAAALLALSESAFTTALQRRIGDYLGAVRLATRRFQYPLSILHAERYVAPRLALISEAAHGIHPIAGQGLNLGLRDVATLARLLIDQAWRGLDLGDPALLAAYESKRRPDNLAMIAATDGLNALFSNRIAPVKAARGIGLALVGRLPPVKRFFMRQAMGLGPG